MDNEKFVENALALLEGIKSKISSDEVPPTRQKEFLNDLIILGNNIAEGHPWAANDHVLIFGDCRIDHQIVQAILKKEGLPGVVFCDPFKDSISPLYNPHCRGVIFGPMPHKMKGGENPINVLKEADIPYVKASSGSDLKITKESLHSSCEELLNHIKEFELFKLTAA